MLEGGNKKKNHVKIGFGIRFPSTLIQNIENQIKSVALIETLVNQSPI